jgi:hypothetical protein
MAAQSQQRPRTAATTTVNTTLAGRPPQPERNTSEFKKIASDILDIPEFLKTRGGR